MVIYNQKSTEKHQKQSIALCHVLMSKYAAEMVCAILWYKLGVFATANKNGTISLGGFETFATIG